ncbi:unnamed protein product [Cuscuta europaea]|nr:unnamed protein product [Cuscuta europaea]
MAATTLALIRAPKLDTTTFGKLLAPAGSIGSSPVLLKSKSITTTTYYSRSSNVQVKASSSPQSSDYWKKKSNNSADSFGFGNLVQDGSVFRQNFCIRSYEIGANGTASIETMMNHLQETALNHARALGLMADGFASTPEMYKRNLIWVVTKMQVVVNHYPTWGNVVQVDTWIAASGKNGMRRDWLLRDGYTNDVLMKGSSRWVMMNKETRRLAKLSDEVRAELEIHFVDTPPIIHEDTNKLPKLDDQSPHYVRTGLTPKWNDFDLNKHVNNVKYIGWILESAPLALLESQEIVGMALEYRRECGKDSVVQSCTSLLPNLDNIQCHHLLRLQTGPEIVNATTHWRPKPSPDLNHSFPHS